jgi:cytochrome c553
MTKRRGSSAPALRHPPGLRRSLQRRGHEEFNLPLRVDQLLSTKRAATEEAAEGDTHVAQCASCHGAHGIPPVKDSAVSGRHAARRRNL